MPDIKWIKISTGLFDDEKIKLIEKLPEADTIIIIWIYLLIQAGKVNNQGLVYLSEGIPYDAEMLASLIDRPVNTVRLALQTFIKFRMIEDVPEGLFILNWEKHQNIDGMEKYKQLNASRAQSYRKRLALVGGYNYLQHGNEVMTRDNYQCVYCGSKDDLVLDHLIPLIKGGDNEVDNLVASCKKCNAGKSGRLPTEAGYSFFNIEAKQLYANTCKRLKIESNINSVTQAVTLRHGTEVDKNKIREREVVEEKITTTTLENLFYSFKDSSEYYDINFDKEFKKYCEYYGTEIKKDSNLLIHRWLDSAVEYSKRHGKPTHTAQTGGDAGKFSKGKYGNLLMQNTKELTNNGVENESQD